MDKLQFAKLVTFITSRTGCNFSTDDLRSIDVLTTNDNAPPKPADVVAMCDAMAGNRKIEAIKAYRALTGSCLVDAKNAIERAMAPTLRDGPA